MNKSVYLLQSLGLSAFSLQNGMSNQIIEDIAPKIKLLSQTSYSSCLVDVSNKLLPVLEDDKFLPIWTVLFEELSSLSHQEEVQAIYHHINEKQGNLSKEILHKLWLSHLPCLESAVLKLVEYVCSQRHMSPATIISDALKKSCLIEIANKEVVIYETVFRMLMSMLESSDFALILTEIAGSFCHMVRNKMMNNSTHSMRVHQLEILLKSTPDPESLSSLCILNTLQSLHTIWKDVDKVTSTSELSYSSDTTSEITSGQYFEDLFCLTIQYRSWVFAALTNVLLCDQKYVESCLWYIAAHHRIKLCSERYEEIWLNNFVCGLRDLFNMPNSKLASQVKSLVEDTRLTLESKVKAQEEIYQRKATFSRSVINLLLMIFFFQSNGGFTVGNEIAAIATSSEDITDHIRCLIYHYHVFKVKSKQWNSVKCDHFLSFVHGMCIQLENENHVREIPDFLYILSELQSLLLDLK